jgi:hypothetical protein
MDSIYTRSFVRLVSLAGLLTLAACNGNGGFYSYNYPYGQHPGPCSYQNARLVLVSPAANATGVADNFPQVIIASSIPSFSQFNAVLLGTIGGVVKLVPFGSFIPSSLPAGVAAPFANATYYASTNPGVSFDSKTSVAVELNNEATPCSPGPSIGSFTVL